MWHFHTIAIRLFVCRLSESNLCFKDAPKVTWMPRWGRYCTYTSRHCLQKVLSEQRILAGDNCEKLIVSTSVSLSVTLSVFFLLCLSVYLFLSVCLRLFVCLSVCLSVSHTNTRSLARLLAHMSSFSLADW